jgi:hypothetical protein
MPVRYKSRNKWFILIPIWYDITQKDEIKGNVMLNLFQHPGFLPEGSSIDPEINSG